MFKIITIAVGIYLLYRMVIPPALRGGNNVKPADTSQSEDTIDIDYEEIP
ncbi:MAG: hypothetical protein ACI9FN_000845 [Saprospiraceae bacterium]|jgi:hypothetical protein